MLYLIKHLKSSRFYQRWSTYIPFLFYTLFILIILNISFPLKSTRDYHHHHEQQQQQQYNNHHQQHNYVDDNSIGDGINVGKNHLFHDSGGSDDDGAGMQKHGHGGENAGENRRKVNIAAHEYNEKLKKNRNELLEGKEIETIILSNSKTEAKTMLKMAFKK